MTPVLGGMLYDTLELVRKIAIIRYIAAVIAALLLMSLGASLFLAFR